MTNDLINANEVLKQIIGYIEDSEADDVYEALALVEEYYPDKVYQAIRYYQNREAFIFIARKQLFKSLSLDFEIAVEAMIKAVDASDLGKDIVLDLLYKEALIRG